MLVAACPEHCQGSLKLLKLQTYGFCLVLSQRGKLVPYKLCLMTCAELAGRSCSHPACHIFASRTNKENHSHTRPGLGQQPLQSKVFSLLLRTTRGGCSPQGRWLDTRGRQETVVLAGSQTHWWSPSVFTDPAIPLCVGLPQRVCPLKLPLVCDLCPSLPDSSVGKESACNAGYLVQFLGWEDPLEKG